MANRETLELLKHRGAPEAVLMYLGDEVSDDDLAVTGLKMMSQSVFARHNAGTGVTYEEVNDESMYMPESLKPQLPNGTYQINVVGMRARKATDLVVEVTEIADGLPGRSLRISGTDDHERPRVHAVVERGLDLKDAVGAIAEAALWESVGSSGLVHVRHHEEVRLMENQGFVRGWVLPDTSVPFES